jgi:hypothetical protein
MTADTYDFDEHKTYLNPEDLMLIKTAMAENMPSKQTFTCAIGMSGEHLACEVDYDSKFFAIGDDYEIRKAKGWVRISVLHPRFRLYMATILVRMEDGRINIEDELRLVNYENSKMVYTKLIMFLYEVLLPAIKLRVAVGKNAVPFSRGPLVIPSYIEGL